MKKNERLNGLLYSRLKKLLLIMKLTTLFLLLAFIQVSAKSYSQSARLNIYMTNVALSEVFDEIESQSEFHVFYKKDHFDDTKKVSVNYSQTRIEKILDQVLTGLDVNYKVIERDIVITKNDEKRATVAQQGKLTGTVVGSDGEPVVGATVLIKGTTTGTVTDVNGKFTMNAPASDAILVVSFIGLRSQEIVIGNQTSFNVTLEEDIFGIEEVVAIGYGTMKKSDLTGAVASIRSEDLVRANPTTATEALQGQVAGVNIQKLSGKPGEGYKIDIRGLSNFNESWSQPLVVIDGVMGGDLNTLNPADIESMDILKDASSTAIYGSRGANGVIIIKTKKGISGKPRVTYSGYMGAKVPNHIPKMMDAGEFYYTYNELRPAETGNDPRGWTSTEVYNGENNITTDWIDLVTDPSLQTSHTVALTGGTENTVYDFSTGYLNEGGSILHTKFNRYTLKAGMESKINDVVKVGLTSYYAYGIQNLSSTEALRSAYRARPTGTPYYADLVNPAESSDVDWNGYALWMGISDKQVLNPLVELDPENSQREKISSDFLGNGFLEISPVKGLTLRSSLSVANSDIRQGEYYGTFTKTNKGSRDPKAVRQTSKLTSYTWDNILTYNFVKDTHNFTFTGLHSVFKQGFEQTDTRVNELPFRSLWHNMGSGTITSFATGYEDYSLLSYMGRLNYAYNGKYMVTITGRYDGSSKLSEGNKWQFFPSAAVAWRAGEEEFIQNLGLFSNLKVRVSYGEVGNDATVSPYATQARIMQTAYDFDGSPAYGFAPENLGNNELVWERSREINIGLNMGFLNNRISTDIEFYKRNTENLIVGNQIPTSKGFDFVTANVGEIMNQGIEVTLNTINIKTADFQWSTNINFSLNHNEVVELYDGITEDVGNLRFVGETVAPIYSYKFDGIWQLDEAAEAEAYGQEPGEVRVKDQLTEDTNGDGVPDATDGTINEADRVIIGSMIPKWLMGIKNTFNYKNFDLSFLIYTRQGVTFENNYLKGTFGDIDSDRYNRSAEINYWTSTNQSNDYYGLGGAGLNSHHTKGNTRRSLMAQSANFWRVSDITFGYTLPKNTLDRLGVGHIRIYGQVGNPFVFTDFIGFNPEYNSGAYNDDLPTSSFLFGLKVSF